MKKLIVSLTFVCLQGLFLFAAGQNKPGWSLQKLSWDIDKAYPGIEYNYRLAIRGGEYPYTFNLIKCPSGMTIDSCTGEITWTPALTDTSSKNQIITHINDLKNNILKDTFVVSVTKKKFYFVAKNGSNSNNGSEASPWATMAYASATADSSSYVYVKQGTYNESAFTISETNCGRFMAYPGDSVHVNSVSSNNSTVYFSGGNNYIFQGFNFNGNGRRYLFAVGGYTKNMIWRNNVIHNVGDGSAENPAGMFFSDGSGNPITGGNSYDKIVVQDNIFYDLDGSSMVCYDVKNMLFENNIVRDIPSGPGKGVADKDMGYMNTFRGNLIYNCPYGIVLMNQGGQSGIEVCYNHVYNCINETVVIGLQSGYINNIFVHHNTLKGRIKLQKAIIAKDLSDNINIYKNIIGDGGNYPYNVNADWVDDYYPKGFRTKVLIDSNIVYGNANGANIAGSYEGGLNTCNWKQWQDSGKDINSKAMQLKYDSKNNPILPDSLKIYGHFGGDYVKSNTNVDAIAPTAPTNLKGTAASQTAINLTWTASTDAVGVKGYRIYRNSKQIGTSATTSYADAGLTASTQYAYSIVAYDAAGNASAQCTAVNVKTLAAPDATAPTVPTNLAGTAASQTAINLTWTASTDAVGVTGYRIYRNSKQIGTSATTSYADAGLTASTQYAYSIAAYDAAGNASAQCTAVNVKTLAAPDATAPTVPTDLAGKADSQTSINLTWTASTDAVGVTGYRIYRDSKEIGTSATTSYADAGLTASTQYAYSIAAYDAADNVSAQCTPVNVTTLAEVSTSVPSVNHEKFSLSQNSPNPFKHFTQIDFVLENAGFVTLKIYDISGREIASLVNGTMPAGKHKVQWDGKNAARTKVGCGVYFYQLKTGNGWVETKKMMLLR